MSTAAGQARAPVQDVLKKFRAAVGAKVLSGQVQTNLVLDWVSFFEFRVAVLAARAWTWLAAEPDDFSWPRLRVQAKTAHCSQPVAVTE